MALLKNLRITNFRGFDALEIDGLSKINLFVGKNNSGKTSALEALCLLFGMSNPGLPGNINQIRGLNLFNPNQFKYLFHNLSLENNPSFKGIFEDNSERELELNAISQLQKKIFLPDYSNLYSQQKNNFSPIISSAPPTSEIAGIRLKFSRKEASDKKNTGENFCFYDANGINYIPSNNYEETLFATYISPDKNDLGALTRYSEIVKGNEKDAIAILKVLQKFDSNIDGIYPLPDGIYFKLKNVTGLVPCNIMGDGIRRFLNIVTAVSQKHDAFILIDEIENGLHYSAYETLWENLISYSQQNNVQLFITTHNIETLGRLRAILEDNQHKEMRNYSKVFSISKTAESKYKAYAYSYEEFKTAIENDLELRK
ncbi:MAG: AAA family ATPase [Fibromonadales bacterium]|nr:AAA family ATPase [Fibromonadales bacterium]